MGGPGVQADRPAVIACRTPASSVNVGAVNSDVLLVSCAYEKLDHPAEARDLYISERFRLARRYAERRSSPWFILSGEHALVRPADWLAPYDTDLAAMPPQYQSAWGQWVVAKLARFCGRLDGLVVEIHAPEAYVSPFAASLGVAGAELRLPLAEVEWDEWTAWYRQVLDPGR